MFNYAKENTGGYVDFDYYDLSDVLTSDGKAVDTSKLRSAIDQADSLQYAEYPMDEWDKMLTLLDKAKQALANEVDAPQRALSLQLAQLAVDRQSGDGGNPGGGDQTGDGNQSGNGDQTGDGGQQQSSTADDNSSELSSTGSSVTPMVLSAIALMLAGISVIRIRRSSR